MPAGILACYGLFNKDFPFDCFGCAVFSNGRIQYDKKYLEFSRMWVSDELKKNTESWLIGKCMRMLQKKFPNYKGVVTWADLDNNHKGTIYLASNFTYDGLSRKVKKFQGSNKKIIYQRTAVKGDKLISEDNEKKRFIYYFNPEERELNRNCNKQNLTLQP